MTLVALVDLGDVEAEAADEHVVGQRHVLLEVYNDFFLLNFFRRNAWWLDVHMLVPDVLLRLAV